MNRIAVTILHIIALLIRSRNSSGIKTLIAENLILKQQLLVMTQKSKRCPPLSTADRIILGLCTLTMTPKRIERAAVIMSSSTLLRIHKIFVNKKYQRLFSNKKYSKPGPKGPSAALIRFIVETKERNPSYGCPKIALLATSVLSINVDESLVRRILLKHYKPRPGNDPSWLLPIGWKPDKLWSLDFFRVESINLKSHWVMVVMDQFSKKIIGFSVQKDPLDGPTVCYMYNKILKDQVPPSYLSTDNDPLFRFHRWLENLETLEVEELKSIPLTPTSHPFIERLISTIRQEFTNKIFFWSETDLELKLKSYQEYYNEYRVHYSLESKTPCELYGNKQLQSVEMSNSGWRPVCNGMFYTPVAA